MRYVCKIISVVLIVALALSATILSANASETGEQFYIASVQYDTAINQLEKWLEQVGQPADKLEQIIEIFDQLENYEMSRAFGYYTKVLMKTVNSEFDYDYRFWIQMLSENTAFQEYLKNTIKSNSIGTVEDLLNYANGIEAEKQGDYVQAGSYYLQCLNYYDASRRYEKTGGTENKSWYEQGREFMEQGKLDEAIQAFEKANGYSDSLERIQFLKNKVSTDIVSSTGRGDINGDETIDVIDILRLQKYIAGQDAGVNTEACDVNQDNDVNIMDVILLQKQIANWETKPAE